MTATFWQRLDKAGRNLAPFAVTVMLVLVGMIPIPIPSYSWVAPHLTLISVYYWTIHRPDLMRPGVAFLIGLLQDLLTGGPLGVNALMLVVAQWAVLNQRRVFLASTFALLWIGFAMVMTGAAFLQWLAFSVLNAGILPVKPALFQGLLTVAMFPAVGWLLIRMHRAFLNG
ncbi:rod shape-determining protein MreD [Azospirillum agricola]|uniref:rod shape-determining protein MreD n=1 Tax=Azospirillum agricola TaxID=1720247 RepID=UPI000A0F2AE9|nr:rod shape-determining protein MreD [Azospirillum agricola]MBP2231347.1 rod shape-determining protein MreD [Azospirillum agricola]SMH58092.1 rod shape-determining protein MreD [Azospirillum lipoferum]